MSLSKILPYVRSYLLIQKIGLSAVAVDDVAGLRGRRGRTVAGWLGGWRKFEGGELVDHCFVLLGKGIDWRYGFGRWWVLNCESVTGINRPSLSGWHKMCSSYSTRGLVIVEPDVDVLSWNAGYFCAGRMRSWACLHRRQRLLHVIRRISWPFLGNLSGLVLMRQSWYHQALLRRLILGLSGGFLDHILPAWI